jgi:hypothetical protein
MTDKSTEQAGADKLVQLLETIANDLETGANDPELVKRKAEELRQIAAAGKEIFGFMEGAILGFLHGETLLEETRRKQQNN